MWLSSPPLLNRALAVKQRWGAGTLPGSWSNLTLMTDLLLQNNSISGQLAPEWGSMPKLYILNLSLNHVSSWPYSQHTNT